MQNFEVALQTPDIDWTDVPPGLRGKLSAVCRSLKECEDLVHWFGDPDFCPLDPIYLMIPGGPGQLAGLGLATVAELRDNAVARWAIQEERIARIGAPMDFDEMREKAGAMRREDVDAAFRQALMDRIAAHKASPVTDPPREPLHVRVNDKTVHTVAKIEEVKDGE